jgi:hypothetical protein
MQSGKKIDKDIQVGLRWLTKVIESDWDNLSRRVADDVAVKAERDKLEKEQRQQRVKHSRELKYVCFESPLCTAWYKTVSFGISEIFLLYHLFSAIRRASKILRLVARSRPIIDPGARVQGCLCFPRPRNNCGKQILF